jgi:hypothetical protein
MAKYVILGTAYRSMTADLSNDGHCSPRSFSFSSALLWTFVMLVNAGAMSLPDNIADVARNLGHDVEGMMPGHS